MGGSVSTNHKSSNRIELSWFSQQFLNFEWFDLTPRINPPNHPPTHQTTHPPMVGNSSQISNLQTELKYLDKLKCYQILSDSGGPPPGGWQMGGWGGGQGGGMSHACTHAQHACTCMLNMLNMDASMLAAICNFYTCINVHVCMCMCVGTPPHAPIHLPPPQSHREPETPKFNKSWTNRDNSILFEDSLPLNIPELI